jgi:hypothetical protein
MPSENPNPVSDFLPLGAPGVDFAGCGPKAARLSGLLRLGLPVLPGAVWTSPEPPSGVRLEALARTLPGPWILRSSGRSEDSAVSSFAGCFLSVGPVEAGATAAAAFARVLQVPEAARVVAALAGVPASAPAVLIQPYRAFASTGVALWTCPDDPAGLRVEGAFSGRVVGRGRRRISARSPRGGGPPAGRAAAARVRDRRDRPRVGGRPAARRLGVDPPAGAAPRGLPRATARIHVPRDVDPQQPPSSEGAVGVLRLGHRGLPGADRPGPGGLARASLRVRRSAPVPGRAGTTGARRPPARTTDAPVAPDGPVPALHARLSHQTAAPPGRRQLCGSRAGGLTDRLVGLTDRLVGDRLGPPTGSASPTVWSASPTVPSGGSGSAPSFPRPGTPGTGRFRPKNW